MQTKINCRFIGGAAEMGIAASSSPIAQNRATRLLRSIGQMHQASMIIAIAPAIGIHGQARKKLAGG